MGEDPAGRITYAMIEIGKTHNLKILHKTSVGLFLGDGENELLLPKKYVTDEMKIGERIEVFVYLDQEERPVATTIKPYIQLHEMAYLQVIYINSKGIFIDWGLENDLFLPLSKQMRPLRVGDWCFVYLYKDKRSGRLVVTAKTKQERILSQILKGGGAMYLTDKSSPEEIRAHFDISKVDFKKCIGNLMKHKLITIREGAIYLTDVFHHLLPVETTTQKS